MKELGFGTLGSVFLAKWKGLVVAVKKMHALKGPGMKAYTDSNRKEILGEAEKMSLFRHPHIVDFYGISYEPEDDIYYLVLKREEGDLRKRIEGILKEEKQTLTLEDKLRISLCISRALLYLQSKGIVHRDLRPGNILLCWYFEKGRRVLGAKICDFGLTRIVDVMTNMSKGVPYFIAPENKLHQRKKPTLESDIYSFGMTLWCIFTINLPDLLGVKDQCFQDSYDDSVTGRMLKLASKCCASNPQNRCKIEEVIAVLEPLLEEEKTKNEKLKIEEEEKERVRRKEMEEKLELLEAREQTRQVEVEEAKRKKKEVEGRMKLLEEELEKNVQELEDKTNELNLTWRRRLEAIREAKREVEDEFATRVTELENEVMELKSARKDELEQLKREAEERAAATSKMEEEMKKEIQALQSTTTNIREELGKNQAKLKRVEAEKSALSSEVEEGNMRNEEMERKLESLTIENKKKLLEMEKLPDLRVVEEEPPSEVLSVKIEELQTKKMRLEMLEMAHNCFWGLNGERVDYYKPHKLYEEIENSGGKLDGNAHFNLGEMYEDGYGVEEDETKSEEFYKKAAEFYSSKKVEDLKSIDWCNMGVMYVDGDGFEENEKKGVELLKKAVGGGNILSMWHLGYFYRMGWGVEKSYSEAFKLYSKAAEMGLTSAMNDLGSMYYNGYGVKKDEKKAFELYREAAGKGQREAMYNVGECYRDAEGVEKNLEEAKKWFKMASKLGNEDARKEVEKLEQRS